MNSTTSTRTISPIKAIPIALAERLADEIRKPRALVEP